MEGHITIDNGRTRIPVAAGRAMLPELRMPKSTEPATRALKFKSAGTPVKELRLDLTLVPLPGQSPDRNLPSVRPHPRPDRRGRGLCGQVRPPRSCCVSPRPRPRAASALGSPSQPGSASRPPSQTRTTMVRG